MEILQTLITTPSLPALFLLSFLAATVLPIGSEWLLVVMVLQGFSIPELLFSATLGNYLGACTTYLVGIWGAHFIIRHIFRMDKKQLQRAETLYKKYGTWSLLLSWLPVVGDPLCLVAGVFGTSFIRFSILVFLGKLFRYSILAFLTLQGTGG